MLHSGGTSVAEGAPSLGASSFFLDTIRLPGQSRDDARASHVRPALAILFRIASGPAADYYTPRFLRREASGRDALGWHWPAFFIPAIWAFYRRLWLTGAICTLLPFAGAAVFAMIAPRVEVSAWAGVALAAAVIWILPGVIPALIGNALVYRRVRGEVRRAEEEGGSISKAVAILAARPATSMIAAALLGGGALALSLMSIVPTVRAAHAEQSVRARLAASLAAVRPLQLQFERKWKLPHGKEIELKDSLRVSPDTPAYHTVSMNPSTGRVRLTLGASIPELEGRTILLTPATDAGEAIRWLCIPVDIPARYLPKDCRGG